MAKSGFVPAWMKIQSSDKTNGNQKLTIERTNNNNNNNNNIRQSQTSNRSETSSTSSSPPTVTGQYRNKSNEQQSLNGFDGQSESFFSFSSPHTQTRRSYSRERLSNSLAKNSEFNDNESYNGYRSINNSQRRLHSISSYSNDRQQSTNNHNSISGNSLVDRSSNHFTDDREKIYGNNEQNSDTTIKTHDNEHIHHSNGFDRLEQDFPSLNGQQKNKSSPNDQSTSVWKNAATKFRTSDSEPFKVLDRSLSNNSNHSRLFGSNRILSRKDRLLSAPNGLNGTSPSLSLSTTTTAIPSGTTNRSVALELQTNCITQTKNLDKRSDFFNSLKNDSTSERNKNGNKRQYSESKKTITNSDKTYKTSKATVLLLSVPETPEEKELLMQMGWKEYDDIAYEITDKDKEEYEKRIQHLPKTDNTSAALMSALNRRALPCIDIRDLLQLEMIRSTSDDDSSDE
ncbi:unnamed protein product [Rotaria magnacalcarata]|uniref:Vasculin n=1 Tax=Rotaria magnacalcarata TaxID=392030 RepID=A0A814EUL5_9BILA|nr:unnamed protein product [Rotaria magnacalcarata]CAF1386651.1 unnamed protein product [Rotaria magnacalcarata]CAF1927645.1 unnamed protein product [Rotaria magnacalcarata]CAF2067920.1 unnamed protein product [Rotaria magnacalcarata]